MYKGVDIHVCLSMCVCRFVCVWLSVHSTIAVLDTSPHQPLAPHPRLDALTAICLVYLYWLWRWIYGLNRSTCALKAMLSLCACVCFSWIGPQICQQHAHCLSQAHTLTHTRTPSHPHFDVHSPYTHALVKP